MGKITYPIAIVVASLIIGGSLLVVQSKKQESIENQKRMEVALEQQKLDAEKEKQQAIDNEKKLKEVRLKLCLESADEAYWDYIEINGTKSTSKDGVWYASQYYWDNAQEKKDKIEASCFKQYK